MSAEIRLLRWPDRDREDYERLAATLARLRALSARGRGEIVATVPAGPESPDDADRARALLAQRRRRDAAAGVLADLFGEPGWDMLLNLFVAYEEGRSIPEAALAQIMRVRPAVAARWLDVLVERGLVHRLDPDGPPAVSLTEQGTILVLRCIGDA